jgi:hypothetical protein
MCISFQLLSAAMMIRKLLSINPLRISCLRTSYITLKYSYINSIHLNGRNFSSAQNSSPSPVASAVTSANSINQLDKSKEDSAQESAARGRQPKLHATFTCTKCDTRSTKTINKQAYQEGVVLIRCPGCKKLHLFADHLGWFGDTRQTIEDIMREKGMEVKLINDFTLANSKVTDVTNHSSDSSSSKPTAELVEHDGTIEFDPAQQRKQ